VNRFAEECRREWKRLRVPDSVADEMAADLAADLGEAEAEGVSAAEVLGSGASDARSFAAAWAAERGVVPSAPVRRRLLDQPLRLAAVLVLIAIAVVGAALAIFATPNSSVVEAFPPGAGGLPFVVELPSPIATRVVLPATVTPSDLPVAVSPDGRIWLTTVRNPLAPGDDSGVDAHTIGSILLAVGMAGIIVVMLALYWSHAAGQRRGPRYS